MFIHDFPYKVIYSEWSLQFEKNWRFYLQTESSSDAPAKPDKVPFQMHFFKFYHKMLCLASEVMYP